jgi:hypothetical protein
VLSLDFKVRRNHHLASTLGGCLLVHWYSLMTYARRLQRMPLCICQKCVMDRKLFRYRDDITIYLLKPVRFRIFKLYPPARQHLTIEIWSSLVDLPRESYQIFQIGQGEIP